MPIKDVPSFMKTLQHARKAEVEVIRAAILAADPVITESIKWNAPSFQYAGDDRVTFRLQPRDLVQLIFHRGAKVKDTTGFTFRDDAALLDWAAPDRGVLTFEDAADTKARLPAAIALVKRWMRETT